MLTPIVGKNCPSVIERKKISQILATLIEGAGYLFAQKLIKNFLKSNLVVIRL